MRKLVIFLYFVFLFKLAFAQSLTLPKLSDITGIEPAAGQQQVAQAEEVPSLEDKNDALPEDFDIPVSGNEKKDEKDKETEPTTAKIDIEAPTLEVPEDTAVKQPEPVIIPPATPAPSENAVSPEVTDIPKLPDQNVNQPAETSLKEVPEKSAADPQMEKELNDNSVRNQFPETPGLDYSKEKADKQKDVKNANPQVAPADREKEVDNLLDEVFDKEKTPEELAAEKEQKAKEDAAEEAANKKGGEKQKIENVVDVNDSPVKSIDNLKTDDDEQGDLADLPESMKAENKNSPLNGSASATRNNNSYTYSEQQLSDLLVKAAMTGDKENVIQLIQSGRNVNAQNRNGESALMGAVYNDHNDIAEILLSEGADANVTDNKGNSTLLVAAAKNNVQAVQQLIRSGADIDMANSLSDTPLLVAALNNNTNIVDVLIRQGADVNKPNADGLTALHIAAFNGNAPLAKYLLSVGANPNLVARGGFRPYDLAKTKNPELAQTLMSYTTNPEKISNAAKIASEIKSRNLSPIPQKTDTNMDQYAMYPKAYVQQPAEAEQIPQSNWWAAKPATTTQQPVTTETKNISEATPAPASQAKLQQSAPAEQTNNNGGVQKADYSNYYNGNAPKPASLATAPVAEDKKWTKLTVDQKTLQQQQQKEQALQQMEIAKAQAHVEPQAVQPVQPVSQIQAQKINYANYAPLPNTQPIAVNNVPTAPMVPVQPTVENVAPQPVQNWSQTQATQPTLMRVRYDANGNKIETPVNIQPQAGMSQPVQPVTQPEMQQPWQQITPAQAPVAMAAPEQPRSMQQIQPQQQPQFYNQPISNNININIPRYADLDPYKQSVWDKKLEEWVINGININAKDDSQKIFWMKQQAILEKVYQEQFTTKVETIKKKIGSSAANVTPVYKTSKGATISSRPASKKLVRKAPTNGLEITTIETSFLVSQHSEVAN